MHIELDQDVMDTLQHEQLNRKRQGIEGRPSELGGIVEEAVRRFLRPAPDDFNARAPEPGAEAFTFRIAGTDEVLQALEALGEELDDTESDAEK